MPRMQPQARPCSPHLSTLALPSIEHPKRITDRSHVHGPASPSKSCVAKQTP